MTEPKKELINFVKRQTNYSESTILEKLTEHGNNIESIILEYNGVSSNKTNENITTNQKIFKAIRENMNQASLNKVSKKQ
jgi:hypothetical protein